MCRLFGCRTVTPGAVAHELLHGANARRFYLSLTCLADRCDPTSATFAHAARALDQAVGVIRSAARAAGQPEPATTFLATDGRLMIACRHGRTLHVSAPEPRGDGR